MSWPLATAGKPEPLRAERVRRKAEAAARNPHRVLRPPRRGPAQRIEPFQPRLGARRIAERGRDVAQVGSDAVEIGRVWHINRADACATGEERGCAASPAAGQQQVGAQRQNVLDRASIAAIALRLAPERRFPSVTGEVAQAGDLPRLGEEQQIFVGAEVERDRADGRASGQQQGGCRHKRPSLRCDSQQRPGSGR